jgi:hypothetical protein
MAFRANLDNDMGADVAQVEAVVSVWLDGSCSNVLGDDGTVLSVFVASWLMVDRRQAPRRVCTYLRLHRIGSH